MRRKIVQQGPTTLMISLPIKWVNKFGLKKGEEIDLEEKGSKISISPVGKITKKDIEINLFSEDGLYIWRTLQSTYIAGYNLIKINFKSKKTLDLIQDSVTNFLIGFEIVEHDKDSCLIKQVSSEINEEFDVVLKRVFQNILQMSEVLIGFLKDKNKLDLMKNLEKMNNRHTIYLKRIIIQENKSPSLYYITDLFEKIANEYKFIFFNIKKNSSNKKFLKVSLKIDKTLNEVYSIFYEKKNLIEEVITKGIHSKELKEYYKINGNLTHHLMNINYFIRNILFNFMTLKQIKD